MILSSEDFGGRVASMLWDVEAAGKCASCMHHERCNAM